MSSEQEFEDEQRQVIEGLLQRPLTPREFEGFRIVYPRFIDRFGGTRLGDLRDIFRTDTPEGRDALASSLLRVVDALGSYDAFALDYPISIIPPVPAYPLFPIVGLDRLQPAVYRVLDGRAHDAIAHIGATGRLPRIPPPTQPVLRTAPRAHWCSYDRWDTPDETRRALQILPSWSNCEVRATLRTDQLDDLAFVAYSIEPNDPDTRGLCFHGYFFEGIAQDHDDEPFEFGGGAVQVCVYGEPRVDRLEVWDPGLGRWVDAPASR